MKSDIKKFANGINIDKIAEDIFSEIYDISTNAKVCRKCNSESIRLINVDNFIYKCQDCNHSFSPRVNSIYNKIRYPNDKWVKLLKCMLCDNSLEECVKILNSNVTSIQKKWKLIYEYVDWNKYQVSIKEKPFKNIYANFEIIVG